MANCRHHFQFSFVLSNCG